MKQQRAKEGKAIIKQKRTKRKQDLKKVVITKYRQTAHKRKRKEKIGKKL